MMPNEVSHALRSSPRQDDGFGASLQRAYQGWRGSTQLMRPEVAIKKINACAEQVFSSDFSPSLEWLNNVNRYLWVLTSGTVVRLDSTCYQRMNRIWETVRGVYQQKQFAEVNPLLYGQADPRKEDLSFKELLLQILGRCQLLEDLFRTSAELESSQATIEELKRRLAVVNGYQDAYHEQLAEAQASVEQLKLELAGTLEEESRLLSERGLYRKHLKQLQALHEEKCTQLLKDQLLLLGEKEQEIATSELTIKLLKAERDNLHEKIRQLNQNASSMQEHLVAQDETIHRLRQKLQANQCDEKVREVEVVVGKDHTRIIRQLEKENAKLKDDIQFYESERAEAVAAFEKKPRVVLVKQEAEDLEEQLKRVREILEKTVNQYDATVQTEPLRAAEALYGLMTDLQKVLH